MGANRPALVHRLQSRNWLAIASAPSGNVQKFELGLAGKEGSLPLNKESSPVDPVPFLDVGVKSTWNESAVSS